MVTFSVTGNSVQLSEIDVQANDLIMRRSFDDLHLQVYWFDKVKIICHWAICLNLIRSRLPVQFCNLISDPITFHKAHYFNVFVTGWLPRITWVCQKYISRKSATAKFDWRNRTNYGPYLALNPASGKPFRQFRYVDKIWTKFRVNKNTWYEIWLRQFSTFSSL